MLIRSIGSICTATFKAIGNPCRNLGPTDSVNAKVNILPANLTADIARRGSMVRFPKLSIAAKLYAIFALLATATVALALVAVVNARRHAALTEEYEAAFQRRAERRAHQRPDLCGA